MFYDPTPPLSSSWSEWPGRFNMPSHYDDEEWERPLGGNSRSYSNPRLRRFDIMDDSPRVSRTSSRSEVEMNSEGDENVEPEVSRPPRVHRIPIFVEERQSSQESAESPDVPDVDEIKKEWEESYGNNTVPRFRRRNFGAEDDLQRSRSHTSAFQRQHGRDANEPQPEPRRRRQNVTTVKVNCDQDQPQVDPKKEQLSIIESVVNEVDELKKQVEEVSGAEAKHCRYLDEMLTRCMLKLDDVNTMGEEDIRLARKNAICNVQSCIDLLESKLHPPVQKKEAKSPEIVADKQVIVLPFYSNKSEPQEVSTPEAGVGSKQNDSNESDKNVIVLPYNEIQTKGSKSPEKTVIVLPYHDTNENDVKKNIDDKTTVGEKSPEKTVIILPYHETSKDEVETSVIALPYYDTNKDEENMCTKL